MKTCPDCGERVYSLGCTNCNEAAYIEEQNRLNDLYHQERLREEAAKVQEAPTWGGYPLTWGDEG